MTTQDNHGHQFRRRDMLKRGAAAIGGAALPSSLASQTAAAPSGTLVVAAPATPQSLDSNFDVSLGTFEAVAALYDNLLEFKKIPDPKSPGASREDIADHPDLPAGLAVQGKLAQSFELDPAGKFIRFQLRQGVKSNWGNELTAEDVKDLGPQVRSGRNRRLLSVDAGPRQEGRREGRGQVHGLHHPR
jgi:peptide/nickel transport system substrate-binding protein